MCNLSCYCKRNVPNLVGLFGDNKSAEQIILKTTIKTENFPLIVVNDQLVSFLSPVNFSRPKFAAAGLPIRQICETRNSRIFFNSALFLLLVGSGRKRTIPIQKFGSSSLVSSIF